MTTATVQLACPPVRCKYSVGDDVSKRGRTRAAAWARACSSSRSIQFAHSCLANADGRVRLVTYGRVQAHVSGP
jgi:hypothetical protein